MLYLKSFWLLLEVFVALRFRAFLRGNANENVLWKILATNQMKRWNLLCTWQAIQLIRQVISSFFSGASQLEKLLNFINIVQFLQFCPLNPNINIICQSKSYQLLQMRRAQNYIIKNNFTEAETFVHMDKIASKVPIRTSNSYNLYPIWQSDITEKV